MTRKRQSPCPSSRQKEGPKEPQTWPSEHEGQEDWHNKPEKKSLDAGRALAFLNSDFNKAFHLISYLLSWKLWTTGRPQSVLEKWPDSWIQRTVMSGLKSMQQHTWKYSKPDWYNSVEPDLYLKVSLCWSRRLDYMTSQITQWFYIAKSPWARLRTFWKRSTFVPHNQIHTQSLQSVRLFLTYSEFSSIVIHKWS